MIFVNLDDLVTLDEQIYLNNQCISPTNQTLDNGIILWEEVTHFYLLYLSNKSYIIL